MFSQQSQELVEKWKKVALKEGGSHEVDASSDISKLTLNIIGFGAFGFDFGALQDNETEGSDSKELTVGQQMNRAFYSLLSSQRSLLNMIALYRVSANCNFICTLEFLEETNTLPWFIIIIPNEQNYFPSPANLRVKRDKQFVDDIVKQLISTKRELINNDNNDSNNSKAEQRPPNDLLELLLSIRDDETGMAFTDDDLIAHVKT